MSRRRRRQRIFRWVVLVIVGIFFLTPLYAMVEFTTRKLDGSGRTLDVWKTLFNWSEIQADYPDLSTGIVYSLEQAALTAVLMLVLLVPTMVWVRLRLPGLRRTMEFICLLPLTIPAIVLVVGLAPIYAWVVYFFGSSSVTLVFAYVVLVLPYSYRALDAGLAAIDVKTLSEAARSLGAGWGTVLWRVVLPNIRSAVLSSAFLSVALVLGELTIASLLNRQNLQVAINLLSKVSTPLSTAVSLLALVLAFVLLFALSFVGSRRGSRKEAS
jgi:putative spermidine/putrescine transport system permease protein